MTKTDVCFFELLQVATGRREALSGVPTPEEWEEIYDTAKKHTLVGVAFKGVERLPKGQLPPPRRIRQWSLKADRIAQRNRRITGECRELCRLFRESGFMACVLKGQANLPYYNDLGLFRTPGDIDVWVTPLPVLKAKIRPVIDFCQRMRKGEFVFYHNLDFPVLRHTPVEVHYRPTWLFNPLRNRRLQRWIDSRRNFHGFPEWQGFTIPSVEFDVLFQLLHVYKHIFEAGIGLRQLLDYYFVLQAYHAAGDKASDRDEAALQSRSEVLALLKSFGLTRFAGAVMYVLREVFAMPSHYMLVPPDEKEGRLLLGEILQGGNFGKYDERYDWDTRPAEGNTDCMGWSFAYTKLRHNFSLLANYPEEVLCEPFFRVYHLLWRRFRLWRWE